jgi:hypothetical protein
VHAISKHLTTDSGTLFISAVEKRLYNQEPIHDKWVGFFHELPYHHAPRPDMARILHSESWKLSLGNCEGLWVLSHHQRGFLLKQGVQVPINVLHHPVNTSLQMFSPQNFLVKPKRRIVFIDDNSYGWSLFCELNSGPYEKRRVVPRIGQAFGEEGDCLERQILCAAEERYAEDDSETLTSHDLVFLEVNDGVALDTILGCISTGTPLLVNRFGAVEEYLGEQYPLYYDSLSDAENKLSDDSLVLKAHEYLKALHQSRSLSVIDFIIALQNTAIYRLLQGGEVLPQFRRCTATVVLCSYDRVETLEQVLDGFAKQDLLEPWELFIWNNNPCTWRSLEQLATRCAESLPLTLIQSSVNFYCMVRLSILSLMKSPVLIMCDDDVVPEPSYLRHLLQAYERLGPRAAVCARGHQFTPHMLNEEQPHKEWQSKTHIKFRGEADDECMVHFMHANSCLIPADLLRQAIQIPMPQQEWALVDDYWLSFVLSFYMRVPLWKIRADGLLRFLPSSEDDAVALYRRPEVIEQKINLYIYHMRMGWPFGDIRNREPLT